MSDVLSRHKANCGRVSASCAIYDKEREEKQSVQVTFSACMGRDEEGHAVQPSFTFYTGRPEELFALSEMMNKAAVALTHAQKFEAKNEAEAA